MVPPTVGLFLCTHGLCMHEWAAAPESDDPWFRSIGAASPDRLRSRGVETLAETKNGPPLLESDGPS